MRTKIDSKAFRLREGEKVKLKKWPTSIEALCTSKESYRERLELHQGRLADIQNLLYADSRHSLLIVFQAMDAAGKDSAIKHVMSGINPQGCQVYGFKKPSAEELGHDFLWRTTRCLPAAGHIGIFNRSYYEDVLVVRVHPELLRAEPGQVDANTRDSLWEERYKSIRNSESHLHRNGTQTIKFFLHVSKDEQRKRFMERIDNPKKNWKLSPSDIQERKWWDDYRRAYEDCLSGTSTHDSPWYIVPADRKEDTWLIVSHIIVETLERLNLGYPEVTAEQKRQMLAIREELASSD